MVKREFTGKLTIHFLNGEVMNEDKKITHELFDIISRIPAKNLK